MGRVPADAIVAGGQVISVQTIEIIRADVAIAGSRIAAVGELPRASRGPRTRMIDAEGMFVSPGLIDGHCECHTISTVPRFQPLPRRTQHLTGNRGGVLIAVVFLVNADPPRVAFDELSARRRR